MIGPGSDKNEKSTKKFNLKVIVEAEGFEPQAKLVEVVDPTHGPAQRLDFDLAPVQVRSRRVL